MLDLSVDYTVLSDNTAPSDLAATLAAGTTTSTIATATQAYGVTGATATVTATTDLTPTGTPVSATGSSSSSGGTGSSSSGGGGGGGGGCFAATETVTLESGATKAISEVVVGDRVLTVNAQGEHVYSDVAYLPHGQNAVQATFAVVTTASGRDLKMTLNHYLPAGRCALPAAAPLPVVVASAVAVGDCVLTVSGRERVVSVDTVAGEGIYTAIAMEELLVVNGIVATPYGGINPALANVYYNMHRLWYAAAQGGELLAVVFTTRDATARLWAALAALSA